MTGESNERWTVVTKPQPFSEKYEAEVDFNTPTTLMFQHELLPNPYLFFIGKLNIAD
jgi:hypothetical protein